MNWYRFAFSPVLQTLPVIASPSGRDLAAHPRARVGGSRELHKANSLKLLSSPRGSAIDRVDRALRDPRSIESIRSSPKGSPLRDPRSIESIEPSGIPDRSSRSSPQGSPIDRVDRALRDPQSIESIEPSGIPDRSSRSSPRGSPIEPDRGLR